MAEIRVGPRRSGVWPWIVGLLLLVILIWVLLKVLSRDDATEVPLPDTSTAGAESP